MYERRNKKKKKSLDQFSQWKRSSCIVFLSQPTDLRGILENLWGLGVLSDRYPLKYNKTIKNKIERI